MHLNKNSTRFHLNAIMWVDYPIIVELIPQVQ